jgi:hypothetical protein
MSKSALIHATTEAASACLDNCNVPWPLALRCSSILAADLCLLHSCIHKSAAEHERHINSCMLSPGQLAAGGSSIKAPAAACSACLRLTHPAGSCSALAEADILELHSTLLFCLHVR